MFNAFFSHLTKLIDTANQERQIEQCLEDVHKVNNSFFNGLMEQRNINRKLKEELASYQSSFDVAWKVVSNQMDEIAELKKELSRLKTALEKTQEANSFLDDRLDFYRAEYRASRIRVPVPIE